MTCSRFFQLICGDLCNTAILLYLVWRKMTPAARITWWTSPGPLRDREFRTASDERAQGLGTRLAHRCMLNMWQCCVACQLTVACIATVSSQLPILDLYVLRFGKQLKTMINLLCNLLSYRLTLHNCNIMCKIHETFFNWSFNSKLSKNSFISLTGIFYHITQCHGCHQSFHTVVPPVTIHRRLLKKNGKCIRTKIPSFN